MISGSARIISASHSHEAKRPSTSLLIELLFATIERDLSEIGILHAEWQENCCGHARL